MGIFGWSYPPGCNGVPDDEEQVIDLAEDKTLKGYGRKGHGLNGKDADLNEGGQNVVDSAYWFENDQIKIEGERYATLVPDEDWTEDEKNSAQEMIIGCGYPGEWCDDEWIMSEKYSLTIKCEWNDKLSDEKNIERAIRKAHDAIVRDSKNFEREMTGLSKAFDEMKGAE